MRVAGVGCGMGGDGESLWLLSLLFWRFLALLWGLQECFTDRMPLAVPCPAVARSSQLGFLCDLAGKFTSILLNQREEKGGKVLASSNKGLWNISAGYFSSRVRRPNVILTFNL